MWTGTPSKNRDYEKGLGRYLGHCIAGVLGNMYTGMGLVIILNIIEMLNKQGI